MLLKFQKWGEFIGPMSLQFEPNLNLLYLNRWSRIERETRFYLVIVFLPFSWKAEIFYFSLNFFFAKVDCVKQLCITFLIIKRENNIALLPYDRQQYLLKFTFVETEIFSIFIFKAFIQKAFIKADFILL